MKFGGILVALIVLLVLPLVSAADVTIEKCIPSGVDCNTLGFNDCSSYLMCSPSDGGNNCNYWNTNEASCLLESTHGCSANYNWDNCQYYYTDENSCNAVSTCEWKTDYIGTCSGMYESGNELLNCDSITDYAQCNSPEYSGCSWSGTQDTYCHGSVNVFQSCNSIYFPLMYFAQCSNNGNADEVCAGSLSSDSCGAMNGCTWDVQIVQNKTKATDENTIVNDDVNEVVIDSSSSALKTIVLNSSVAEDKVVTLNMNALLAGNNVTLGSNDLILQRISANTYEALLPAGTVISGNSSWDGMLNLPVVKTLTTSKGTVNVAVEMGATQRLSFSNAVKITLGGMAGKNAIYTDDSGEHEITACADANSTSAGSLTSGECFLSSGNDLIVWTYHFTTFAAYTPASSGSQSGGSSGGSGVYIPPKKVSNVTNTAVTPNAVQNQPETTTPAETNTQTTTQAGGLSGITGAVIGALGGTGSTIAVVFIVVVVVGLIVFNIRRKNE